MSDTHICKHINIILSKEKTFVGKFEVLEIIKKDTLRTYIMVKILEGEISSSHNAFLVRDGEVVYDDLIWKIKKGEEYPYYVDAGDVCRFELNGQIDIRVGEVVPAYYRKVIQNQ
jgi:translation initiation factor IF-2